MQVYSVRVDEFGPLDIWVFEVFPVDFGVLFFFGGLFFSGLAASLLPGAFVIAGRFPISGADCVSCRTASLFLSISSLVQYCRRV